MKDLKFIRFKKNSVNYTGKISRSHKVIYFYPTYGYTVRIYVINGSRILDKLGTITRFKNSNEIQVVLNYHKCRFWIRSGAKISFDNFSQSMVKLRMFDKYEFL